MYILLSIVIAKRDISRVFHGVFVVLVVLVICVVVANVCTLVVIALLFAILSVYMSDLYSRENLTTTEVTPGLLREVAASLLRNTTIKTMYLM